ncbi:CRISPR-associated helicase/endonuclease Cas3 [Salinispora arenicola]|uniref:Cas3 protein I-C subtype 2 n=1 Tax=Salinispora arenicola TaxID=168697 RepID=A0A059U6G3_SALAC|nr:CRISPR-associated helicase/endonuclease Cas3 [Salinispora arenicola]AHZ55836.1 Cas3 protein I-C subtype 2 [Salinispora arenicola]AHZ55837.1 Cas3 protein I-C subtype 2 [Salinispora arenicola]AHZ55838.1 Cas3 protein I-C subtype 2 [Salinispora arenicola]AHZ55840.1 Cas3 protein I-C subtype 2 [Salinispora arenicola]
MTFLRAHSPAPASSRWHFLADHLRSTAELAREFTAPFAGGDVAYWLGALHDVGKASCAWQDRLAVVACTGGRVGIDHKSLGTRVAYERGLGGFAGAIFGHHGGLVDTPNLRERYRSRLAEAPGDVASAERELPGLLPDLPERFDHLVPAQWRADPLVGEMALRLCYSALVDADSLDTSAHFQGLSGPRVRPDADFGHLYKVFEQRRRDELAGRGGTPIGSLREQVYADCLAAAERERGVFRLGAPTGAGKTLASGGFALRHAEKHNLRRVIVAVPFLTITEQNAAVYRRLLDQDGADQVVLEHHSQVDFDDPGAGRWARLAAENWDAPFVVTTFVRLFESLYARKPSAMRRVHRLANSVIVLDEVQALPHAMLAPILDGIRLLVRHFGVTVLLSSATQPSFWALDEFKDVPHTDLTHDTPKLVSDLRRVRYEWQLDPKPTLADVGDQAASEQAALVVVNTTADAKTVYDRWREIGASGVAWHLSTRMCPDHRRRVLGTVRARLRRGEHVLLVATQLIEAGVDVDFPLVFRAMAPADSLLQAAGRANREGRMADGGRVVVFAPEDGGQPPTYKTLVGCTGRQFGPDKADPDDLMALGRYYRNVYSLLNLQDVQHVGQRIQQARRRWEFETVADGPIDASTKRRDRKLAFRMISDDGISVVTPQGAGTPELRRELEQLIEELRQAPVPDLKKLRRLQAYTTNLHPNTLRQPGVTALLRPILGGSEVRRGVLAEWVGEYDDATGINLDPSLEQFVL